MKKLLTLVRGMESRDHKIIIKKRFKNIHNAFIPRNITQ